MSMVNPWVWVTAWMGVIFIFSTDHFSGAQTSRFIEPVLKWIIPTIPDGSIANVQLVIRKIAHLVEYAILSILICRALAKRTGLGLLSLVELGRAVLIATAYAAFDEWHQSWTAERYGSVLDVVIDTAGAAIGVAFFVWLSRRENRVNGYNIIN